jgi:hypothetical protein
VTGVPLPRPGAWCRQPQRSCPSRSPHRDRGYAEPSDGRANATPLRPSRWSTPPAPESKERSRRRPCVRASPGALSRPGETHVQHVATPAALKGPASPPGSRVYLGLTPDNLTSPAVQVEALIPSLGIAGLSGSELSRWCSAMPLGVCASNPCTSSASAKRARSLNDRLRPWDGERYASLHPAWLPADSVWDESTGTGTRLASVHAGCLSAVYLADPRAARHPGHARDGQHGSCHRRPSCSRRRMRCS